MSSAGPTIFWRRSCKIRPCRRRERRAPRPRGPALFSDQRVGQLRSFGTAPNLTFAPLEVRIIILAPGIDIAARRPIVPLSGHLVHPAGLRRGKVVHLRAVGGHVEKLPRLLEARDEFPLAVADGAVPFLLPKDRLEIGRASCRERVCQYV